MQGFLQELIMTNIFAFLLIFTRVGTVISIMPGLSDSFIPMNIRLMFALSFSFILTPFLAHNMPEAPSSDAVLFAMVMSEAFIGIFIGLIMRMMLLALSVAGAVTSIQSGLSNATVFNPATQSQGSVFEAIYVIAGLTLIFVSDMHHYMLSSTVYSYSVFPVRELVPDVNAMTETIASIVNNLFLVGVKISLPFVVVITLLNIGMGLLGRLMPQMQIFFIAIPLQIMLSILIFIVTVSYALLYWLSEYEAVITKVFS